MIEEIFKSEREREFVRQVSMGWQMSPEAVIRHFFRLGQLVDHYQQQGYKLLFGKDGETVDPFDLGPKLAPMPPEKVDPFDHISTWEGEGGSSE